MTSSSIGGELRLEHFEIGTKGLQLGRRNAALFQARQSVVQARRLDGGGGSGVPSGSLKILLVRGLVGSVGQLVHDRLGVGPDPGERPEQASEHERQQTQRAYRLELRMV